MSNKEIIGTQDCPGCGKETALKINKNGSVYTYCVHMVDAVRGERCMTRVNYGRTASKRIKQQLTEDKTDEKDQHADTGDHRAERREFSGGQQSLRNDSYTAEQSVGEPKTEPEPENEFTINW